MMSRVLSRPMLAASLTLLLALPLACADSTSPNSPETVSNRTDNFRFRLNDVTDLSGTFRYFWKNTGTTAEVNRAVAFSKGLGGIEITDDAGALVFSGPVTETGVTTTDVGQPGDWTVTVLLVRVGGSLDFTVTKK